jgi:hypothetical protein
VRKFADGHLFSVRGSLPAIVGDPERRWAKNVSLDVVAATIDRALAIAREAHGDMTVFDVVHRGGRSIYVDDELLEESK